MNYTRYRHKISLAEHAAGSSSHVALHPVRWTKFKLGSRILSVAVTYRSPRLGWAAEFLRTCVGYGRVGRGAPGHGCPAAILDK